MITLVLLISFQIGDLGLSKVKQHTLVSGGVRGTLPWMAPELLSGKTTMVTEKVRLTVSRMCMCWFIGCGLSSLPHYLLLLVICDV